MDDSEEKERNTNIKKISEWDNRACEKELMRISRAVGFPVIEGLMEDKELENITPLDLYHKTIQDLNLKEKNTQ